MLTPILTIGKNIYNKNLTYTLRLVIIKQYTNVQQNGTRVNGDSVSVAAPLTVAVQAKENERYPFKSI